LLSDALPKELIATKFAKEILIKEMGHKQLSRIITSQSMGLFQIGMSIWNRIIVEGTDRVNPQAIAKYVRKKDKRIHAPISSIIGKPIIFDIYHADITILDEGITDNRVAEIFLAHVYPNNLLIDDVVFQNPYIPIPVNERISEMQHFKGLGLLRIFIDRIKQIAIELKCNYIILNAATKAEYALFQKYGFEAEDSPTAKKGLEIGYSIPMQLDVKNLPRA